MTKDTKAIIVAVIIWVALALLAWLCEPFRNFLVDLAKHTIIVSPRLVEPLTLH